MVEHKRSNKGITAIAYSSRKKYPEYIFFLVFGNANEIRIHRHTYSRNDSKKKDYISLVIYDKEEKYLARVLVRRFSQLFTRSSLYLQDYRKKRTIS